MRFIIFRYLKFLLAQFLLFSSFIAFAQTDIVSQGWQLEWNRNYKEACQKFLLAVKQYPDSSRAWKGKADMELKLYNDTDKAILDYNRAILLKPKAVWALFERGKLKYGRKDYEGALEDLNRAINLKSDYREFYTYRAACKSFLHDHNGAIKDYTFEINADPGDATMYYHRANEYCWLYLYDSAIADCDRALQIKRYYGEASDLKRRAQKAKSGVTQEPYVSGNPLFTATSSTNPIDTGQEFEVRYSLNTVGSNFQPPSFAGFIVVSGPTQSSSIQLLSGRTVQLLTISYVLKTQSEGAFTIEPATIKVKENTLSSNSLEINVKIGSPHKSLLNPTNPNQHLNNSSTPKGPIDTLEYKDSIKKNLFVKLIPNKENVYIGEQVFLNAKLYTRINLESVYEKAVPAFPYFYFHVLPPAQKGQLTQSRETINGIQYIVATLDQIVLYPKKSGKLKIDTVNIQVVADMPIKSANMFDQFFGGSYKRTAYNVPTNQPILQVNSLPHTDKSFSGLVGHFKVNVSVEKDSVKSGDSIYMNVTLTGTGNLKLLNSIPYKFPEGLKHLAPSLSDTTYETGDGLVLSKRIYHYSLISETPGSIKVNATTITYFDPNKKNYADLAVPGFSLIVSEPVKH